MKKRFIRLLIFFIVASAFVVAGFMLRKNSPQCEAYTLANRPPEIRPDYSGIVIPPNIAPLNFVINEPGENYYVYIHTTAGQVINIYSKNGKIKIPPKKWKSLLQKNHGNKLFFDIYVKTPAGRWNRYDTVTNTIAKENIDPYIAYRFMTPSSYHPKRMGVYQQNLETGKKRVVLHSNMYIYGCVNCHSFAGNRAGKMLLGVRIIDHGDGTLLVDNGRVSKIGSKFGYTSWHPTGRLAAYSINSVRQFFHLSREEIHDVIDLDSSIVYYDVDSQTVKTTPALSDKNVLETYPAWTPDGKYLYYCTAPILWQNRTKVPYDKYMDVKYSLKRISYDIQTDKWGEAETVLPAEQTGKSIMLPRISPDGRFLLFCICDYGCFPVYQPSSDLYLMDLKTGEYQALAEANSEQSESWHSWSSNSRWFAFSSKRRGGLFTKIFLSYVDETGRVYKPFLLPQKDPDFYDSHYKVYSVPELTVNRIEIDSSALNHAACGPADIEIELPITSASPPPEEKETWRQFQ